MSKDMINPEHYQGANGTQTIDFIEESVKGAPTGYEGYLQGNILKYMSRVWRKENPLQDLKKAEWYLKKLIEEQQPPAHVQLDIARGRKARNYNAETHHDIQGS